MRDTHAQCVRLGVYVYISMRVSPAWRKSTPTIIYLAIPSTAALNFVPWGRSAQLSRSTLGLNSIIFGGKHTTQYDSLKHYCRLCNTHTRLCTTNYGRISVHVNSMVMSWKFLASDNGTCVAGGISLQATLH